MDLKNEYVTGGDSYRVIARRHALSYRRVCTLAKEEGWAAARREYLARLSAMGEAGASTLAVVTERLLRKVEAAVLHLDDIDPDLSRLKQLAAVLKDIRDIQKEQHAAASGDVRVLFVGQTEDFSA